MLARFNTKTVNHHAKEGTYGIKKILGVRMGRVVNNRYSVDNLPAAGGCQ